MLLNVLNNGEGPALDIVCLNAGAALYAADVAPSIEAGIALARKVIADGSAKKKLDAFVQTTQILAQ
jgi:anthranilate phosphoribosyltransferase